MDRGARRPAPRAGAESRTGTALDLARRSLGPRLLLCPKPLLSTPRCGALGADRAALLRGRAHGRRLARSHGGGASKRQARRAAAASRRLALMELAGRLPNPDFCQSVARTDVFSATAARMSAFNAFSSISSPSWKSMARRVLPSRLELKRPEGSSNEAPLAKVIFTTFLYVSPVQIIPACDHTGTPLHFHSSTTSGSACLMRIRTLASVSPRQSLSSLILASIS